MCESKKGWNYQMEGNYKLNDDLTSSLNYVLFNVLFDDKIISTRILDEFPLEEECLSMMCDTKEEFIRSLTKK
jgi:hypothetical protein